MRLFLASHDFGAHAAALRELVGKNRQTLIITNARDYVKDPAVRAQTVQHKLKIFREAGFDAAELYKYNLAPPIDKNTNL